MFQAESQPEAEIWPRARDTMPGDYCARARTLAKDARADLLLASHKPKLATVICKLQEGRRQGPAATIRYHCQVRDPQVDPTVAQTHTPQGD